MMLDGNAQTYFHVTWNDKRGSNTPLPWSEGSTYGDGKSSWPYIEIAPAEPIQNFQFSYTAGPANRRWKSFTVQGSNNGTDWEDIEDFEEEVDALPTSDYGTWTLSSIFACRQLVASTKTTLLSVNFLLPVLSKILNTAKSQTDLYQI